MAQKTKEDNKYEHSLAITSGILAVLVFFGFLFYRSSAPLNNIDLDVPPANIVDAIIVEHSFADGVHTYVGMLDLPSPCHTLKTGVGIAKSLPELVTIGLVIKSPIPNEVCVQVVTPTEFEVSFKAHKDAGVVALLNGSRVVLDVREQ